MISKEKIFFLNQLLDSMDKALEKFEQDLSRKKEKEVVDFIISIQSEIKNLLLIVK